MQVSSPIVSQATELAHFDLENEAAYMAWREQKQQDYPACSEDLLVTVNNFMGLTANEHAAIHSLLTKANMCVYQANDPAQVDKQAIKQFAAQFGYKHLDTNICADKDSISSLQTKDAGRHAGYIPYSNRKISWHTDGYYNKPENTIRGMLLHCVNNAPVGGENQYLDPDILYIHLRDKNPDFIRALMDEKALTIPANEEAGVERAAQTGPVFSLDNRSGRLHLRYTARTRSIEWDDSSLLKQALAEITQFLAGDSVYIFTHKLKAGQGVLCNNVLHNRTAFEEQELAESKRLIYRARYYDRATGT